MKELLLALSALLAVSTASVIITAEQQDHRPNLGTEECTWGPTYWCENLKTAKGCNAVKHCVERYWEKMEVPEDTDNVCGICKEMVQQARDQLESNQTQQDLKDVFEGSCKLIHIKPIVDECIKIVDEFVPELVETLASQMNPSVVCSVAGLCNNAHIDKLLAEHQAMLSKKDTTKSILLKNDELEPDECTKCYTITKHMENKMQHTSRDTMFLRMLHICGEFDSFSDACANIIISNFDNIYEHIRKNFNADNICHLSGQCSGKYHKHEDDTDAIPKVEITPLSSVGMVEVDDDLPCKLCEQLVGHLKDLLVANTTEIEFKHVLLGLCRQTKSFADECGAIVSQYYSEIYEYLTKGLNSNIICHMTGVCPSPDKMPGPIWPLVSEESARIGLNIMNNNQHEREVAIGHERPKSEAEEMQLPLERLMPFPLLQPESIEGKEACALCEYLLHYIQDTISSPTNEEKVKQVLGKICRKLPSIGNKCQEFVDTYGDAIVAILVQEIDPAQVCPMLHVCPSRELLQMWAQIPKGFLLREKVEDKPSCPLCLLAVTQIYNAIKDNKTEATIEAELDKLCKHLPNSLTDQCYDFVKSYSKELVDMLLADLTPQEVCVYLKLCDATKDAGPKPVSLMENDGEILTNEIPDYPLTLAKPKNVIDNGLCVVCEYAMQYIDQVIGKEKNREKIEKMVHGVCNHLPKSLASECNQFVDKYADVVITILSQDVSPKEVCVMIGLCKNSLPHVRESIVGCALCRAVVSQIDHDLGDPKVDAKIEDAVLNVCKRLLPHQYSMCNTMVKTYGPSMINMLKNHVDSEEICDKIALCIRDEYVVASLNGYEAVRNLS
ncbi:PREDICTED: prosaposin isoform X2 [Dinoponera quadriceps]|uniref:Prosaposin isoform X2 n=1 Tax=Dinoponera quadriceps TaxID=609295 RepID=A0A6P3WMY2_DINQU|nr:PREDICTED: prosaposin isoform X2 [Dinoponera quadriceps]